MLPKFGNLNFGNYFNGAILLSTVIPYSTEQDAQEMRQTENRPGHGPTKMTTAMAAHVVTNRIAGRGSGNHANSLDARMKVSRRE